MRAAVSNQFLSAFIVANGARRFGASAGPIQPRPNRPALVGDYRSEHLFVLKMGWELHRRCQHQISQCEQELAAALEQLPDRGNPPKRPCPPSPKARRSTRACARASTANWAWIRPPSRPRNTFAPSWACVRDIGFTPAQVAAQAADSDYLDYVLKCLGVMQNAAQQWTAWKDLTRDVGSLPTAGSSCPDARLLEKLRAYNFPKCSSTTCLKLFSPGLTMANSRLAFSTESLACAALTVMFEPNSRRMEPGGALDGSVGPSTSRILRTASRLHKPARCTFACRAAGARLLF